MVCLRVRLLVGHVREPRKNGWIDQDAYWIVVSCHVCPRNDVQLHQLLRLLTIARFPIWRTSQKSLSVSFSLVYSRTSLPLPTSTLYSQLTAVLTHSTETALVNTLDYIYTSAGRSLPTILVSLDLSAAFDTIDHCTLLNRLENSFGVTGLALSWIRSYLSNCSQCVAMGTSQSNFVSLNTGVPQGSALGPLLFSWYTSPVGQLISSYGISHQRYADDTQLFISIPPAAPTPTVQLIKQCLIQLHTGFGSLLTIGWFTVTCKLIACTPGSAPDQTLGNEYGKPLPILHGAFIGINAHNYKTKHYQLLQLVSLS